MNLKISTLPILISLALVGCSNELQDYPNFTACYNDTDDANKCVQYIDETHNTRTVNNYDNNTAVNNSQTDNGFDNSSALTGAAVGAAAGYALGSNNNNSDARRNVKNTASVPLSSKNKASTNSKSSSKNSFINKTKIDKPESKTSKVNLSKSKKSSSSRNKSNSKTSKSSRRK